MKVIDTKQLLNLSNEEKCQIIRGIIKNEVIYIQTSIGRDKD